jgi:methionyl-tRNA formyltransferase
MDEGGVYSVVREPIQPDDTCGVLSDRLAIRGAEALRDALPRIAEGSLTAEEQPAEGITLAPLLKKEDGRLDFSQPAASLERRVRAMDPWPGAYTTFGGAPLKVFRAAVTEVAPAYVGAAPGTVIEAQTEIVVMCGDGAIAIEELQLAGKRRMRADEYLRGARFSAGVHLGE